MDERELKDRTKAFALRVLKVVNALPKTVAGKAVANQLIRSGTSVAANYRAACICRSKAEFTAKLGVVLEETDESCFWLEFIEEGGLLPTGTVKRLLSEGGELRAIFTTSIRSAKGLPSSDLKSKICNHPRSAPTAASRWRGAWPKAARTRGAGSGAARGIPSARACGKRKGAGNEGES